jgi:hypothetical protein
MQCGYRCADDDFFCEKYQVWYALADCNFRVVNRTYDGCVDCFQGRVNLRREVSPAGGGNPHEAGALLPFPGRSSRELVPLRAHGAVPPKP